MKVIACLAVTPDGRLGPAGVDVFTPITSPADLRHLEEIRCLADATVFGGETFRTFPKEHLCSDPSHRLAHLILTRHASLDWNTPLFASGARIIVASPRVEEEWTGVRPATVESLLLEADENRTPGTLVEFGRQQGWECLLVEGGGHVLELFLQAGCLQELYLTIAPQLLADARAPALLPGRREGAKPWSLELLDSRVDGDEVYLHYRVKLKSG